MSNTGMLPLPADVIERLSGITLHLSETQPEHETAEAEPIVGDAEAIEEDLTGDCLAIVAEASDGTVPVKLVAPGWSKNGRYYSPGVLQRDGAKTWPAGTQMFWNHQTAQEEAQRPEGDLRDLAAVTTSDPVYDANGPDGPGLYARFRPLQHFKDAIKELAPHIGVSIRALARASKGEAEGRKGQIISEFVQGRSVDFVTRPGAGGKVLALFESARLGASNDALTEEAHDMADETETKLQEATERISALEADVASRDQKIDELSETLSAKDVEIEQLRTEQRAASAQRIVESALAATKLPELTRQRLVSSLTAVVPLAENAIDEALFGEQIAEAISTAEAEIAAIAGSPVKGMGGSAPAASGYARLKESFKRGYLRDGKSDEEAERLAETAARGR